MPSTEEGTLWRRDQETGYRLEPGQYKLPCATRPHFLKAPQNGAVGWSLSSGCEPVGAFQSHGAAGHSWLLSWMGLILLSQVLLGLLHPPCVFQGPSELQVELGDFLEHVVLTSDSSSQPRPH